MKVPNYPYTLAIRTEDEEGKKTSIRPISDFSTLEELEEKIPQLFELNGTLYAV